MEINGARSFESSKIPSKTHGLKIKKPSHFNDRRKRRFEKLCKCFGLIISPKLELKLQNTNIKRVTKTSNYSKLS
jgi:hypothetical protein